MGAVTEGNQLVFRIDCHKKLENFAQRILATVKIESSRNNNIYVVSDKIIPGLTRKQMNVLKHYLEVIVGVKTKVNNDFCEASNILSPLFTNNFIIDTQNNSREFQVTFSWSVYNPYVFPLDLNVKTIDGDVKLNSSVVNSPYLKEFVESSSEIELLGIIPCKEKTFYAYLHYYLSDCQGLPSEMEFSAEDLIEVLLLSEYLRSPRLLEYCTARLCRVPFEARSTIVFNIKNYAKSERLLPEILRWIEASWDCTEQSLKDQFLKVITDCTNDFLENLLKYAADQKLTNIQTSLEFHLEDWQAF
jgi:hypothetical protein